VDGSAASLADAAERLLVDAALHARLARAARERICERFDSRRTTVALHDLFIHQFRRSQGAVTVASSREART
jgi:glycosyltransferase involved in cell wall biosynthesis